MKSLLRAALMLVIFLSANTVASAQSEPKAIFGGQLNCRTGKVVFSEGPLATGIFGKRAFPSLQAARAELDRAYNKNGIEKVVSLLNDTCKETFAGAVQTPGSERTIAIGPRTAEREKEESMLLLEKKGLFVQFRLFDSVSADLGVAEYMERVMSHGNGKRCRPISSVCWKCTNGKIICSTPKVNK